ncbi:exonuclease SbcCD subunit D [Angelakisella massiliensis]|uniref:exonuclease SbcCD subunit D n=1 Tax=Angelakisella massiliensis TaxID=1871018 RepID=UPI0023A8311D|nr:exonuclease SbcCD subunit D [Angelakisella massiliensis]
MKFLHLSDLHFGKLLFEYSLLEDQEYWCRQVLDLLQNDPHDAVIIAGDLYDRSVPPGDAVAMMDRFLTALVSQLRLPVLAIAGNHDGSQRLAFGAGLYRNSGLYLSALPSREVERITLEDRWGPVDFWLLPYLTPADGKTLFPQENPHTFQESYRLMMEENLPRLVPGRRNVLVAHGFFCRLSPEHPVGELETCESETTVGTADLVDAALFEPFQYCAFGHLHGSQRAGSERMRYCGSPLAYSVSEERQVKSVLSVELDGQGNCTVTPIVFSPLRKVRSVSGTMEELCAPTGGTFVSDDYVFVNLMTDGVEPDAARRIRNLYPHYLGIRYVSPLEKETVLGGGEALRKLDLCQAFRAFYEQTQGEPLTEDAMRAVRQAAQEKEEQS